MGELEKRCFEIISNAGLAKSNYIEAIQSAKKFNFKEAKKLIEEADLVFNHAHDIHLNLLKEESTGAEIKLSLLLIHTEDQLMNAESAKVNALEFLELYEKIKRLEENIMK